MTDIRAVDPVTDRPIQADDLVDWMLTMYLEDAAIGDGRYAYQRYPGVPRSSLPQIETVLAPLTAAVAQYAAATSRLFVPACTLSTSPARRPSPSFRSARTQAIMRFGPTLATTPSCGSQREFDLSGISGSIPMEYWAWHDIEEDADFLEVQASVDGKTWQILKTESCTDADALSASFYCDYTGKSGAGLEPVWIRNSVDLFSYGGKKVKVRFEYTSMTTDTGLGFLLDDISVPDLDYSEGFEYGDGGWRAEDLPASRMSCRRPIDLLSSALGPADTTVEDVELSDGQTASIALSLAGRDAPCW